MTTNSVSAPFPIFTDTDGDPLDLGYVYIGQPNLDAQSSPKSAYWDAALTIPAAQPIRTRGGYPVNNGTPARIYVDGDYSIKVNNRNGTLIYNAPTRTDRFDGGLVAGVGSAVVTYTPVGTGAAVTTVESKLREFVSITDFYANGVSGVRVDPTGVVDSTVGIQAALNSGAKRVYAPAGSYLTTAALSIPSQVEFFGDGKGRTVINCTTSSTTTVKRIIRSAAINFDGVCQADNYTTYYNSTGDYFVSGPSAFAAASTIKPGASSFAASGSVSISADTWLHMSEGIPAWHPAKSEFVQVASTSGSTVNLKTKLRNGYANTTTSLGAFIRSYALTANPGGGGAGYPDMSTWADAGYRVVTPVVNSAVRDMTILCNQSGSVSKIAWIAHLAVRCEIDVEVIDGTFWVVDCQDLHVKVCGGAPALGSSYVGNGTNGVVCDIDISNQIAIEEGAQNISGVVKALGYSTIKQFSSNVFVNFFGSADATPALEVSTVRNVVITPFLKARGSTLNVITPLLSSIATNIPQSFLSGEVPLYYGCGLTTISGECISSDNPSLSIRTANGGQVRCIDTVVPVIQSSRFKGTQMVDGKQQIPNVSTFPAYFDIESGENFHSSTYGQVQVTGQFDSTVASQFNYPGTLNQLIVNNLSSAGIRPGDIAVFRVSDSASAPVNWSWAVVQVTKVNTGSQAIEYTPANSAGRTAITAANENKISFFRINNRFGVTALKTLSAGADAELGGNIGGIGTSYGAPIQLGAYNIWVDSGGYLRVKNGVPTSQYDGQTIDSSQPSVAAANIASAGDAINLTGKFTGKLVWDTTNNRMMRASGSSAGSAWWVVDGSASVTPA